MKNGEMAVKRKAKRPGQQKRKTDSAVSGREQAERQPTQQAERQATQQADKQRLRQQGRESMHADYRTEACMESFSCANCVKEIHPDGAGSNHRNHCPYCLYSLHVDEEPGDRKASCHGKMEPAGGKKNGSAPLCSAKARFLPKMRCSTPDVHTCSGLTKSPLSLFSIYFACSSTEFARAVRKATSFIH